jgi:hypothetical protein
MRGRALSALAGRIMPEFAYPFPWRVDGKFTRHYLMSRVTEAQVQIDIIELLLAYRVDVAAIDAGGKRARGRLMGAARNAGVDLAGVQNVKTGRAIPKGFADLEATLAPQGRSLYIEVKAPPWMDHRGNIVRAAGEPSEEQLAFLLGKFRRGALVMVAWSATEVMDFLGEHLRRNRMGLI